MQRTRGRWGIGVGIFLVGLLAATIVLPWAMRPRLNAPSGSSVIVFSSSDPKLGGEQLFASTGHGEPPVRVTESIRRISPWLPLPNPFGSSTLNRNSHPSTTPGVITFVSNLGGEDTLYQIDIDGRNQRRLDVLIDEQPLATLSPDGAWVAIQYGDRERTLTVRRRDGTAAWCLSCEHAGFVGDVAWSPDSQQLAYGWGDGTTSGIFIASVLTRDFRQVTPPALPVGGPSWSPDGTHLVFAASTTATTSQIFTIRLDGTELQQLTATAPTLPAGRVVQGGAAWSPDGTRIAFTTTRHGGSDIYVINCDGTGEPRVTWSGRNYDPTWVQMP